MARSLNKKYFGNRNVGTTGTGDDKIGGQGVASVTIGGSWAGFTAGTTTVSFSAPQLPGGVTATGTAVINGSNAVTGVTITEKGSGYTTAPSVTIADSDGGAETTGTAVAVLTTDTGNVGSSTNQENAITPYAYVTGGSRKIADIISQKGARRFKVTTADGTEVCSLVTDGAANAAGEMDLTALDSAGGEYWVKKISSRRCTVVRKAGGSGGTQFATDSTVPWTFGSPIEDVSIQIANA